MKRHNIAFLAILTLIILLSGILFFNEKEERDSWQKENNTTISGNQGNGAPSSVVPPDYASEYAGTTTDLGEGWVQYEDAPLGFSFAYPAMGLKAFPVHTKPTNWPETYGVAVLDDQTGYGIVNVAMMPSGFQNLDELFTAQHKILGASNGDVIDQPMVIAGLNATVMHEQETEGAVVSYESLQHTAYLFEGGKMYSISVRGLSASSAEQVWKSFKFLGR